LFATQRIDEIGRAIGVLAVVRPNTGVDVGIHAVILLVVSTLLLGACGPPVVVRPRDGAPPVVANRPMHLAGATGPYPTLAPAAVRMDTPVPTAGSGTPAPVPTMLPTHVIVATDGAGANLRTGPSTTAPVIATLTEGTPVEALGDPVSAEGRSWRPIRSGDRDGWVVAVVVRPR
jgi:hypothetical protein